MEVPDIIVAAAQVCGWLLCWVVKAFLFDQVLPLSVVGLAVVQYALELPLLGLLAFVGPCNNPATVSPNVRLGLTLPRDAVVAATPADTRDIERVEDLYVGQELQRHRVARRLRHLEQTLPPWIQLLYQAPGLVVFYAKHYLVAHPVY